MNRFASAIVWAATSILVLPLAAAAAPIDGEWLVEDGSARVGIEACGDELIGFVAWEKEHGLDDKNPDPAKRTRPTLGMSIFSNMQAKASGGWLGEIYNAEDGKTYSARVTLISPTQVEVQGCVPNSVLCGSETWTKAADRRATCRRR